MIDWVNCRRVNPPLDGASCLWSVYQNKHVIVVDAFEFVWCMETQTTGVESSLLKQLPIHRKPATMKAMQLFIAWLAQLSMVHDVLQQLQTCSSSWDCVTLRNSDTVTVVTITKCYLQRLWRVAQQCYKNISFNYRQLSEPPCHTTQSVIITTGIFTSHLKPLYLRPQ